MFVVELRQAEPDADAAHLGVDGDEQHLRHAGDSHAPGRGVARALEVGRKQKRGDQRDIEQHRRAGGGGETLIGVEHAGKQSLERHEREIGEGDAGERYRHVEAGRVVDETRREDAHHPGREQERERKQHEVDGDECRGDAVGEELGRVDASLLEDTRIGRHEGGGEGALGEDGAEMVGQAEGDEEGVGHGACAQHRGHDHVADEARDAGDERPPADGGDALDHWWSWAVIPPPRMPQEG